MKNYFPSAIICILTGPLLAAQPAAKAALAYWPQWRGPLASGVAPQANPPLTWSDTNNIRWSVKFTGAGTATPLLWENSPLTRRLVGGHVNVTDLDQGRRPGGTITRDRLYFAPCI
jgi:hypothetical protein